MDHVVGTALVVEAHDPDGVAYFRRDLVGAVKPGIQSGGESGVAVGNVHGQLVVAEAAGAPDPDFRYAFLFAAADKVVLLEDRAVVGAVGLMPGAVFPRVEEGFLGVGEAVYFLVELVALYDVNDLVVDISVAGIFYDVAEKLREFSGVLGFQIFGQFFPAFALEDRIVDYDDDFRFDWQDGDVVVVVEVGRLPVARLGVFHVALDVFFHFALGLAVGKTFPGLPSFAADVIGEHVYVRRPIFHGHEIKGESGSYGRAEDNGDPVFHNSPGIFDCFNFSKKSPPCGRASFLAGTF